MQILVVHNTLNDSRSLSGALRHFLFMANEWTAAGHQTDFLAARAGFPQIAGLSPKARLIPSDNIFDATHYVEKTWRYFPAYGWRMLTPHFTGLPSRYDVIIASTQLIVEVYPAMILARRQKAKFAAKVHHVLAAQAKRTGFFDRLFLWSERKTMRWLNQKADLVICGTRLVENDFHQLEQRLGLPPSHKTTAIGYGVDLSQIPLSIDSPKRYDLVHLGRLHEHKGVFHLPEIWREIVARKPDAQLVVIGEGPHRSRVEQMFRELGLSSSVTFTGGVDEATKNRLLTESRVGLSLSFEEGWGLSINEFLAAGLPVVAYGLPIFDVVFPGQLANVAVGDRQGIVENVLRLLAAPARQRELGIRGRDFVQRYDFRNVAQDELAALQKLF
jgi:glycosyltransferase involved in cell wall biosynthesis